VLFLRAASMRSSPGLAPFYPFVSMKYIIGDISDPGEGEGEKAQGTIEMEGIERTSISSSTFGRDWASAILYNHQQIPQLVSQTKSCSQSCVPYCNEFYIL
jgi:hypothetical protein